jgi:hypothetical protein
VLMPANRDLAGAQAWMTEHTASGIEGVVVKDLRRAVSGGPGRVGHGAHPHDRRGCDRRARPARGTADAAAGPGGPRRPSAGGRTAAGGGAGGTRRGARAAAEAASLARPDTSSRLGQLPRTPVAYTPAEPQLVVEVDADVCWEQDRWRHATAFRRIRADLRPRDIPLAGLR